MKEYIESSHFLGTLKKSFIERDEIIYFKKRFLDRKTTSSSTQMVKSLRLSLSWSTSVTSLNRPLLTSHFNPSAIHWWISGHFSKQFIQPLNFLSVRLLRQRVVATVHFSTKDRPLLMTSIFGPGTNWSKIWNLRFFLFWSGPRWLKSGPIAGPI